MSEQAGNSEGRGWVVPMRPRSPHEGHRSATPLELFFDLVFVIAVAQVAAGLHHGLAEAHVVEALTSFAMVFFAIWWAWMNFTWFASAYDNDDVLYRLMVFVQLVGSLILAAGVGPAFEERNFGVVTLGYIVMRVGLIAQWLRAARSDAGRRPCAYRYVLGIGLCQLGWIGLLFAPEALRLFGFLALAVAEIAVPLWAERVAPTSWHAGHIAERYGLFTIIVLGESLLSAALAIQSAIQAGALSGALLGIIGGGLLIVLTMWWLYFDQPSEDLLTSLPVAFVWGYGHLLIFAAAAAVGAGLAVAVDYATDHAEIGPTGAGAAVAVPVAIYLLSLWALVQRPRAKSALELLLFPAVALLVLLTPFTGQAPLLTGLLLVVLLGAKLALRFGAPAPRPGLREPASD